MLSTRAELLPKLVEAWVDERARAVGWLQVLHSVSLNTKDTKETQRTQRRGKKGLQAKSELAPKVFGVQFQI